MVWYKVGYYSQHTHDLYGYIVLKKGSLSLSLSKHTTTVLFFFFVFFLNPPTNSTQCEVSIRLDRVGPSFEWSLDEEEEYP